eukprot:tig00021073_g18049.t1
MAGADSLAFALGVAAGSSTSVSIRSIIAQTTALAHVRPSGECSSRRAEAARLRSTHEFLGQRSFGSTHVLANIDRLQRFARRGGRARAGHATIEAKAIDPPKPTSVEIDIGDGKIVTIETGMLARQADGSAVLRCGNCVLLATVCAAVKHKEGADFLPLSVDYVERYSAAGRFPGGFLKRESKMSDNEVLISRIVDRAVRPLFPDDFHAETQILVTLVSADSAIAPDALAGLAASAALAVSDVPFHGPFSEVRVARVDGKLVINPFVDEIPRADIDMIVSGSLDSINMVEGEMNEVSKEEMLEAILFAHEAIKAQCRAVAELAEKAGKAKREYCHEDPFDEEMWTRVVADLSGPMREIATAGLPKLDRQARYDALYHSWVEANIPDEEVYEHEELHFKQYFNKLKKRITRRLVLDEGVRLDGRKLDEVRDVWCAVDYLPSPHGSAVFTRGETQALATVTLGNKQDEQMIDGVMLVGSAKFLLHYNFPGFSTGEVKPNRAPGRREVGHGNLAQRALKKVVPSEEECPYTIRCPPAPPRRPPLGFDSSRAR